MTPNEHIMMSELFKCSYMNNTTKEKCNNSIIFCLDLIQDFQIKTDSVDSLSSLNSLWRLLHRTVGVEGLKLLLDSGQRVGQFTVIQNNDGLLYPRQQVWGQRLVLFDHLLRLDGLIQNLGQKKHSGIETLELIADVTTSTSPFQLSFPRRPAVSSWRSSGRMPPRRWWWTSHLGSLWTHLHNKAREEKSYRLKPETSRKVFQLHQSLTFRVQQFGHTKLLLCYIEGVVEVVGGVGPLQSAIFQQVRSDRRQRKKMNDRKVCLCLKEKVGGTPSSHLCLCMRALKAMPSFQLVVKLVMLTLGYLR